MCSGERSSSANGAIALRQSAAAGWSTSSSSVLSLWTIRGPSVTDGPFDGSAGCSSPVKPTDASRALSDSVPRVSEPLTVMFLPESAYGPTNQCIGLGKVLLDRGHRVVFAAEASWAGRLQPYGFVEALVDLAEPDPDAEEGAAGQFWIDFVNETAPEFAKPTRDQLATFVQPTYAALVDGRALRRAAAAADHRRAPARRDRRGQRRQLPGTDDRRRGVRPDRVVQPARGPRRRHPAGVLRATRWPTGPSGPASSRSSTASTPTPGPSGTPGARPRGRRRCAPRDFMHTSPDCNLYVYPRELDYTDARPLDDTWHRIDSSVRETDEDYVAARRAGRPARGERADLPLAGVARRRRRRAHAAADRRARHDRGTGSS